VTLKRSIQASPDAPFQIGLGPASFYLDEIRDIYNALSEFSKDYVAKTKSPNSPGTVRILALTATAEEFEDLKEATRAELDQISLILSMPKIRVDLWRYNAGVIAESDSDMVAAFARNIRDFVTSRRNWRTPLQSRLVLALLPYWLLIIASYATPAMPKSWGLYTSQGVGKYNLVISVFFTVFAFLFSALIYSKLSTAIKVRPIWRREQRGVSAQTRTAIIVGVTCAIIAGIIGLWAGIFVHG
jgi:hypothetical protein